MTIMHFDAMPASGASAVVTLSGAIAIHQDTYTSTAGFAFTTNGTTQRREGNNIGPVNFATDWIIPRSAITTPSDWEVRGTYINYVASFGNLIEVGNASVPLPVGTVGNWYPLNTYATEFYWRINTTISGGTRLGDVDVRFEMRNTNITSYNTEISVEDGAAIAASGVYSASVEASSLS